MERLWAPWRSSYVAGLKDDAPGGDGCFLCAAAKADDPKGLLVLGRSENAFIIMNRYPYNTGHLMIACNVHRGVIEEVATETATEMWRLLVLSKGVLAEAMQPHGFNIGINQGRCSGAGVTDHLHMHIVPRWDGDTNFMPTLGGVKVMSQSLTDLYENLLPLFASRGCTP